MLKTNNHSLHLLSYSTNAVVHSLINSHEIFFLLITMKAFQDRKHNHLSYIAGWYSHTCKLNTFGATLLYSKMDCKQKRS